MALIVCLCRVKILQCFMLLSVAILLDTVSDINERNMTEATMRQRKEKKREKQHLFDEFQICKIFRQRFKSVILQQQQQHLQGPVNDTGH